MIARRAVATTFAFAALGLCLIACVFVTANGLTISLVALCSAVLLCVLLAVALFDARARRRTCALCCAAVLACLDVGYIASRLVRTSAARAQLRYCDSVRCDARAPSLARLVDEDETARFGLALSSLLGLIGDREKDTLERALAGAYARHRSDPRFAGLPNAIFIGTSGDEARHLLFTPDGDERVPCLVFLHGFGGQLSVYVEALVAGGLDDVAIIAPYGERRGTWSSVEERQTIATLIDAHLPPRVDRSRVFLVGLSNGASATTHLLGDASMRARLAGAVLISGSDVPANTDFDRFPVLVVTGDRDPRFPRALIMEDATVFASRGAEVRIEIVPGDHFIVLTRHREVAARVGAFVDHIRPRTTD